MLVISAHWFCILRLCWSCLPVSGDSGPRWWGLLNIKIMSSASRDNLTSFFANWKPFIYFSCLISLARNSNTILEYYRRWERASLSRAIFQRECFQFLPIQYDIGYGFVEIAFIILRYGLLIPSFLRVCSIKGCWIFVEGLLCIYWDNRDFCLWFCLCGELRL